MATINNSDLSREVIDGAKIAIGREKVPDQISDKVVAVMECNPKLLRRINLVRNYSAILTGTANVYTTPADSDFYLSSLVFSITKDATCDLATGASSVTATIDGVARALASLTCITLTAQDKAIAIAFELPIKIDRNTIINIPGAYTAGLMARSLCITGYIVNNSNV